MKSDHDSSHARAPYREAGKAYRSTITRANQLAPALGSLARAVLEVVLGMTTSYSKLFDDTTTRQVAERVRPGREVAGYQRDRVSAALHLLDDRGVIGVERVGRGRGARLRVTVWDDGQETPPATAGLSTERSRETPAVVARKTRAHRAETPAVSVAHLEGTEKNPEHDGRDPVGALIDIFATNGGNAPREDIEPVVNYARALGIEGRALLDRARDAGIAWPSELRKLVRKSEPTAGRPQPREIVNCPAGCCKADGEPVLAIDCKRHRDDGTTDNVDLVLHPRQGASIHE